MNDRKVNNYMTYKNMTYTINPYRDGPVMYATLTIKKDVDIEIEKKLASMNEDFVDAKKIIESVKYGKRD